MMNYLKLLLSALLFLSIGLHVEARPHYGDTLSLKQPDGTQVSVKVYGNEFYQDVESLDGYTLIRDHEDGIICYARLSKDSTEYLSTGIKYTGGQTPQAVKMIVKPGIRIKAEAIKARIEAVRKSMQPQAQGQEVLTRGITKRNLPDTVYGVTILIDFPDKKSSISPEQVERFCNGDNYKEFGNARSIKEYFQWISSGKLTYINKVVGYYTAPRSKSYYDCPSEGAVSGNGYHDEDIMRDIVVPSLNKEEGFDLDSLTTVNGGICAINILYAGTADAGWANGLWAHQGWWNSSFGTLNGFKANAPHLYQMAPLEAQLTIGTFIHENGHMILGWPDFYSYDGHNDNNASKYQIGGPADFGSNNKNPGYPNPYVMDEYGWLIDKQDITSVTNGRTITLSNTPGSAARWNGTYLNASPYERYYLQVRYSTSEKPERYNGLFIWHVNLKGNNTYKGNPEELDCRPAGANDPCFKARYKDEFNESTDPSSKWHNGRASGLKLWAVSEEGSSMSFRVGTRLTAPELISREHGLCPGIQNYDSLGIRGGIALNDTIPYRVETTATLPAGVILNPNGVLQGIPETSTVGEYQIPITIQSTYSTANDTLYLTIAESQPYMTNPYKIAGAILLSNYDKGGKNVAYHDTDDWNEGNANSRVEDGIDINKFSSSTLKYITKAEAGEWMQYTVNVLESGNYAVTLQYATPDEGNQIRLMEDGVFLGKPIVLPTTNTTGGTASSFKKTTFNAHFQAGTRKLRLLIDKGSELSLYRLEFEKIIDDAIEEIQSDKQPTLIAYTSDDGSIYVQCRETIRTLRVLDTNGQQMEMLQPASDCVTLSTPLSSGVYFLQAETASGRQTVKIVK